MKDLILFIDEKKLPEPLSKAEVYELLEKINIGNKDARDKLIKYNLRLVLSRVSKKFYDVEYDKEDLTAVGTIGLMKAVSAFDISKGVSFSTYAAKCIDLEIINFIKRERKNPVTESFESVIIGTDKDEDLKLKDIICDDINIESSYIQSEQNQLLHQILETIPKRNREIIKMYFGFYGDKKYNQKDIAKKYNISHQRISQIIENTLKELKRKIQTPEFIVLQNEAKKDDKSLEEIKVKNENIIVDIKKKTPKKEYRKLKSIYDYFWLHKKEMIDLMLAQLTSEEMELFTLINGDDLLNPSTSEINIKNKEVLYYGYLLPKMGKILDNLDIKYNGDISETEIPKEKQEIKDSNKNILIEDLIDPKDQEDILLIEEEINNADFLKSPEFIKIIDSFSQKESLIATLRFGWGMSKCFTPYDIAKFLGIEIQEVFDTTKNILLSYKEKINKDKTNKYVLVKK